MTFTSVFVPPFRNVTPEKEAFAVKQTPVIKVSFGLEGKLMMIECNAVAHLYSISFTQFTVAVVLLLDVVVVKVVTESFPSLYT